MLKADLHVHSKYSSDPADLLIKKFGTQESYSELEEIYADAKSRGMNLVTVTDHNNADGAFRLVEMYPKEAFTGVELTTSFPEDDCAVHILVYGFTRAQFALLDRLRVDIYALRDYIKSENLAYSVAHATYSVNGKLSLAAIEKLILLFDVFETVNGARVQTYNDLWKKILSGLTRERIDELRSRHNIVPMSDDPWQKGFTGGSDEHAGLFVGGSFTLAEGASKEDFLNALKSRRTDSGGRSNHYKTQVFTFLKIAYQASRAKRGRKSNRLWDELCALIFDGQPVGWKIRLKIEQMKRSRKEKNRAVARQISGLMSRLTADPLPPLEERIDLIYSVVAAVEDTFFVVNAEAFKEGFQKTDVLKLVSAMTGVFRSFFLSLPFLGTFRHLHQSSAVIEELQQKFLGPLKPGERKILWFSDTLNDLNGVSFTLNNFAREAALRGRNVRLVTVHDENVIPSPLHLELPKVYEYEPDFYKTYRLRFPSLLKSLELIYSEHPTEVMVSTPGPVGLVGVLAARLFGVPCRGIYHSDFTRMTELGLSGGTLSNFVQGYVRWFYSCMDQVKVPSEAYRRILVARGYNEGALSLFKRGLDKDFFAPVNGERLALRQHYGLDQEFTLLYVGRVSKDKSIGFLVDIYQQLRANGAVCNLVICGDGPELEVLRKTFANDPRVKLTGRVEQKELVDIYSMADVLVFPSTMDTFGMAVLEAQSCSLPALVSNIGGPQNIVINEQTGYVLPAGNKDAWVDRLQKLKLLFCNDPAAFSLMRANCRESVGTKFSWDDAVTDIFKGPA